MAQEPVIRIWPGSGSFSPGLTPFGYFDGDTEFILDSDKIAVWCSRRLGYPITDVELLDLNFYAAFEESIVEFGNYVNSYNARDNMISLMGQNSGSNLTGQYVKAGNRGVIKLAKQYGTEVGAGGELTYYTGSINLIEDQQVYDLDQPGVVNLETGSFETDNFTLRKIFHSQTSPFSRFLDPTGFSGIGNQTMLNQFGWGNMGVSFTLMPLHFDLLRMQGIEMHNQIRKSAYSFQLTGNRFRIFPIPKDTAVMHFLYSLDDEVMDNNETGKISDISNIPYNIIPYSHINDYGKNWIRRYTLALSKEMLGLVRNKYSTIPIPGNEVTLNGSDLVTSAASDMEMLITDLKETLESFSLQAQLERKEAESTALQSQLKKYPSKIYIR